MKFLQDLVPGCSKITGKAVMLDEIINYVQSLQWQVETDKRLMPLKEQLASVNPVLEDLRIRKEERIKQFPDIKVQIEKINGGISGCYHLNDAVANHINLERRLLKVESKDLRREMEGMFASLSQANTQMRPSTERGSSSQGAKVL